MDINDFCCTFAAIAFLYCKCVVLYLVQHILLCSKNELMLWHTARLDNTLASGLTLAEWLLWVAEW